MSSEIRFEGTDFFLELDDIRPQLLEALKECAEPGRTAEPHAQWLIRNFDITGDEEDCRGYLRGYGAWGDRELQDHQDNLAKLVWLTGCSINEGEEVYFCNY